jgi:hypothetical protein
MISCLCQLESEYLCLRKCLQLCCTVEIIDSESESDESLRKLSSRQINEPFPVDFESLVTDDVGTRANKFGPPSGVGSKRAIRCTFSEELVNREFYCCT